MHTTHHLRYITQNGNTVRPTGLSLQKALANLKLQPGDDVRMQDGQLVARVVASLTDFDDSQSRSFCESIIQHPRELVLMRRTRQHGRELLNFVQFVYADRHVTTLDGSTVYQVLSNSFGEPHWVSLSDAYCCVNRSCYEADKLSYHQSGDMMHPVC